MGSFKPHTFDPLELESSIWALGATDCPNVSKDGRARYASAFLAGCVRRCCRSHA